MSEFYILSLRWTRSGEECVTWWGPDNSGYVHSLENAGRYSAERVKGLPGYYDNRLTTLAVPCEIAEKWARRIVHVDLIDKVASETMGAQVHVTAPFEEELDHEGKPYECKECETRSRTKGPSKLLVRQPATGGA